MGERLFDELARALAEPMPRRGVLRLAGAALVAAAVPGLRPRVASARLHANTPRLYPNITCGELCQGKGSPCGVDFTDRFGQTSCRLGCCLGQHPGLDICCKGEIGDGGTAWCCAKGYRCGRRGEQLCVGCAPGLFLCADKKCCSNGQVCHRGECRDKCPPKTKKCGKNCCTLKQGCRKGKCCDKCGTDGGPCCDTATEFCCREPSDKKSPGRCCKKNTESCCPVGPPGAGTRKCCAKPNKCKRQLPDDFGGLESTSPWVCCPPERQVPVDASRPDDVIACCAPGQVSLGGKFTVGQGIQGDCCPAGQICGSGSSVTCCQTFTDGTDRTETCCNGRCVSLLSDPQNCGACGKVCPAGQTCRQRVCVAA